MKPFVNSILIAGTFAIFASTSIVAQPGNPQFEQWYRAKYGRPSPAAQTTQAPTTSTATPGTQPTVAATEFEHWYRAKYGRPSPTEQALVQVPPAQPAVAQVMLPSVEIPKSDRSAKTPADHQRLAQSYRTEAQSYLAQAKEHASMVAMYKANPSLTAKNPAATIDHCEYFAAKFHDLAAKSQQLAQMHEEMAKQAGK